jgi:hypothetical protein
MSDPLATSIRPLGESLAWSEHINGHGGFVLRVDIALRVGTVLLGTTEILAMMMTLFDLVGTQVSKGLVNACPEIRCGKDFKTTRTITDR